MTAPVPHPPAAWRRPARLFACLAVMMAAVALVLPGRSEAMPGPGSFTLGMIDYPEFQSSSAPTRAAWLQKATNLHAAWIRIGVAWSQVAARRPLLPSNPADPNYDWSATDAVVRSAAAAHLNIAILVVSAPPWAEGAGRPASVRPGTWEPNAAALGQFAHAIAARYSGSFPDILNPGKKLPQVRYFQAWNEPNLPIYLTPQYGRTTSGACVTLAPLLYRPLLNAFYAGVKKAASNDLVLAAGTGPYGDLPCQGIQRVKPVAFWESLLCLSSSLKPLSCPGGPAHFDIVDHHPYGPSPLYHAHPGDIAIGDMGRLSQIIHAAQKHHLVAPAGPKPLWVTEMDFSSNPPTTKIHNQKTLLAHQAHNLEETFWKLWTQKVANVFWFQLRDPVGPTNYGFNDGGLYFADGSPKPAAAAYAFPFVAVPSSHGRLAVWGKAPAAGKVSIQKRVGRHWKTVLKLRTTSLGIFYSTQRLGHKPKLRAKIGGFVSPSWTGGF